MEYLKTFWSRRYLLAELVKKGIKLKYRRSYLMVFAGAYFDNDRIDDRIWNVI